MKKTLVALAALAAFGTASAQSTVTLFGVLDASISGYSNKSEDNNFATPTNPDYVNIGSVTTSRTGLSNSAYTSSRLGFRGTEDLGGGLAASFWLEAGLGNDAGGAGKNGALFNRRSTVSLSGAFGEVRLGRDYTPTFWNDTVFDPFGTNGVGTSLIYTANNGYMGNMNYDRASNSVGFFLPPNLGGFYGQLMYSFHEQTKYSPGDATPRFDINGNPILNQSRTGGYAGVLLVGQVRPRCGAVPSEPGRGLRSDPQSVRVESGPQGQQVRDRLRPQPVEAHGPVRHCGAREQQGWCGSFGEQRPWFCKVVPPDVQRRQHCSDPKDVNRLRHRHPSHLLIETRSDHSGEDLKAALAKAGRPFFALPAKINKKNPAREFMKCRTKFFQFTLRMK
ncbi:hypothetical protein FHW64_000858 [Variovorax sp. Sphag1AA]|nr:hypothetical protein [Variovorax sp. Sphag1AA]